jgi:predicted CXXCH cytochrome family protein
VMHGPVAVNACNFCHNPHSSKLPALLKAAPAKLCMQCHGPTGLSQGTVAHADAESNCLDCHSGHGGAKNLLKVRSVALDLLREEVGSPKVETRAQARGDGAEQNGEGTP